MQLSDFIGKPCRSRTAFEFIPKRKENFDLGKTASLLRGKGIEIEVETPFLLILTIEGAEISFFKSGKIIVKGTKEEAAAKKAAEQLVKIIG